MGLLGTLAGAGLSLLGAGITLGLAGLGAGLQGALTALVSLAGLCWISLLFYVKGFGLNLVGVGTGAGLAGLGAGAQGLGLLGNLAGAGVQGALSALVSRPLRIVLYFVQLISKVYLISVLEPRCGYPCWGWAESTGSRISIGTCRTRGWATGCSYCSCKLLTIVSDSQAQYKSIQLQFF